MGAASSVRSGEEIANSIARIHPTYPDYVDPKVARVYSVYSKKEGLSKIFSNECGQDSFMRFLDAECNYKNNLASKVSENMDDEDYRLISHAYCLSIINTQSDDTSEVLSEMSDDTEAPSSTFYCQADEEEEKILRESITKILLSAYSDDDEDQSSLPSSLAAKTKTCAATVIKSN